jgi:hypothetical protein
MILIPAAVPVGRSYAAVDLTMQMGSRLKQTLAPSTRPPQARPSPITPSPLCHEEPYGQDSSTSTRTCVLISILNSGSGSDRLVRARAIPTYTVCVAQGSSTCSRWKGSVS